MKSGLGDRNNDDLRESIIAEWSVSMKSGLGDRNNHAKCRLTRGLPLSLNEVRSWRPEQF